MTSPQKKPHKIKDEYVTSLINNLMQACGAPVDSEKGDIILKIIQNTLKSLHRNHNIDDLNLMMSTLKEMSYAFSIFHDWPGTKRVSIFGSARTPPEHPDFKAAKEIAQKLSNKGWMCITGAAHGIMQAGMEGAGPEESFGLSIDLPYENTVAEVIVGDPKLINFKYFFTRKLTFASHSHAIIACPGGFGTQDELFEILTLMQTGKSPIIPVILLEGEGGEYWSYWEKYIKFNLLDNKWISAEDVFFYHRAKGVEDAFEHIQHFYKRFHSYSHDENQIISIILNDPITEEQVHTLNTEFKDLVFSGEMRLGTAFDHETVLLDQPRLIFHHRLKNYARFRMLINSINNI